MKIKGILIIAVLMLMLTSTFGSAVQIDNKKCLQANEGGDWDIQIRVGYYGNYNSAFEIDFDQNEDVTVNRPALDDGKLTIQVIQDLKFPSKPFSSGYKIEATCKIYAELDGDRIDTILEKFTAEWKYPNDACTKVDEIITHNITLNVKKPGIVFAGGEVIMEMDYAVYKWNETEGEWDVTREHLAPDGDTGDVLHQQYYYAFKTAKSFSLSLIKERLFNSHPNLFPLLQQLLQRLSAF